MIFKCKQCQKAAVQNKIDEAEFKGTAILVMEFQSQWYKIRWIFKVPFSRKCDVFSKSQKKKVFQITILKLKFKFPDNNSKQQIQISNSG